MPIDDRILETLAESQLILSPSVIAINISKSREEVSRRLSEMVDKGLVVRVDRGYYEISELGTDYIEGNVDMEELGDEET